MVSISSPQVFPLQSGRKDGAYLLSSWGPKRVIVEVLPQHQLSKTDDDRVCGFYTSRELVQWTHKKFLPACKTDRNSSVDRAHDINR